MEDAISIFQKLLDYKILQNIKYFKILMILFTYKLISGITVIMKDILQGSNIILILSMAKLLYQLDMYMIPSVLFNLNTA